MDFKFLSFDNFNFYLLILIKLLSNYTYITSIRFWLYENKSYELKLYNMSYLIEEYISKSLEFFHLIVEFDVILISLILFSYKN